MSAAVMYTQGLDTPRLCPPGFLRRFRPRGGRGHGRRAGERCIPWPSEASPCAQKCFLLLLNLTDKFMFCIFKTYLKISKTEEAR